VKGREGKNQLNSDSGESGKARGERPRQEKWGEKSVNEEMRKKERVQNKRKGFKGKEERGAEKSRWGKTAEGKRGNSAPGYMAHHVPPKPMPRV